MATYKKMNGIDYIRRLADDAVIPPDPANNDYAQYLLDVETDPTCVADADPVVPVVPQTISDRQFFQQLAIAGVISQAEALAAVKTGEIPAALEAVVQALPSDQAFAANMLLSGATVFERSHPMTTALAAAMQWTNQQVDALWTAAAAL